MRNMSRNFTELRYNTINTSLLIEHHGLYSAFIGSQGERTNYQKTKYLDFRIPGYIDVHIGRFLGTQLRLESLDSRCPFDNTP